MSRDRGNWRGPPDPGARVGFGAYQPNASPTPNVCPSGLDVVPNTADGPYWAWGNAAHTSIVSWDCQAPGQSLVSSVESPISSLTQLFTPPATPPQSSNGALVVPGSPAASQPAVVPANPNVPGSVPTAYAPPNQQVNPNAAQTPAQPTSAPATPAAPSTPATSTSVATPTPPDASAPPAPASSPTSSYVQVQNLPRGTTQSVAALAQAATTTSPAIAAVPLAAAGSIGIGILLALAART